MLLLAFLSTYNMQRTISVHWKLHSCFPVSLKSHDFMSELPRFVFITFKCVFQMTFSIVSEMPSINWKLNKSRNKVILLNKMAQAWTMCCNGFTSKTGSGLSEVNVTGLQLCEYHKCWWLRYFLPFQRQNVTK